MDSAGIVYILGSDDGKTIKIGHTDRAVSSRLAEHENIGKPNEQFWTFLASVRGTRTDEGRLIRHFRPFSQNPSRKRWEYFHPAPELAAYIRWLRKCWFVARTLHESETHLERVSSDRWLPNEDRLCFDIPFQQQALFQDNKSLELDPWRDVRIDFPITGDDYYTDPRILEAARTAAGGEFDLDPASHPLANRKVRATKFYTVETNGKTQPWYGKVWLNPPYSEWDDWVPKLLFELRRGKIECLFALVPTRSLTSLFPSRLIECCSAVCFTRGRIKFWGEVAGDAPDDGHAIFYFGENVAGFVDAFTESIGPCLIHPVNRHHQRSAEPCLVDAFDSPGAAQEGK